jgi:multidrug efflux pump subunit AcrB
VLKRKVELDYFQAELYLKMQEAGGVQVVKDSILLYLQHQYPQAKVGFSPPETIFERIFSNNDPPLLAKVSINNASQPHPDSLVSFAAQADSLVRATTPNRIPLKQQLIISIDQEKLLLYGVDYNNIYQTVTTAFNENQFATLQSYQRFMPIILGEDAHVVSNVLLTRKVQNYQGDEFPLNTFISIRRVHDLKYITAGQQGEYIPLGYDVTQKQAEAHKTKLRQLVNEKHFPDVQFAGSLSNNRKMFDELTIILIISVLLLYFILAAQFESLLQPLIVLLEIPIDIAGALFLLWIFGDSLNIMSGIGIIIMCGVIINDSILKVDTINQLQKKGLPLMMAIKQGGKMRLGSILMTATTTIFAVLPFFWGSDIGSTLQQPLSLALIGGMVVGTFVSLFFVPLVYWAIYRKNEGNEEMKTMKE